MYNDLINKLSDLSQRTFLSRAETQPVLVEAKRVIESISNEAWHSVKDALPTHSHDVLVAVKYKGSLLQQDIAYLGENEEWSIPKGTVMFWRELPKLP